ncbi:hypothetical protein [Hymenobacter actinosclerus]|uniref:Uncharacterized protein n=1 Tax=Hymenobacter actinosclerus TaxID=82805 RepID=A0A1I0IKT5_9BACT|nr:hypothetical protein [Hymenobacter actinosclerus]SET96991.1 hypothetical protein SAMN04487998_3329 [Hymenobacter actinosclerus]
MKYLKHPILILFFIALCTSSSSAQGNENRLALKKGYITIDTKDRCLYLDTIQVENTKSIPSTLVYINNYIIGIGGCGQIYKSLLNERTAIIKATYSPRICGNVSNVSECFISSPSDEIIFISVTDGYLSKKKYDVVKIDLSKDKSNIIYSSLDVKCIEYSNNFSQVLIHKNNGEITIIKL